MALHFSKISQEYLPLNTEQLPAYLPAPEILRVTESYVAERLYKLKCRKSTQPIDLPSKVRKQFPCELATHDIERVQKLCMKIILGEQYNGYESALETCGLEKLSDRRESRCL